MKVLGLTVGLIVGGQIIGGILGRITPMLGYVGTLVALAGMGLTGFYLYQMLTELKNFTKNPDFTWWFAFIPCFGLYFLGFVLPPEVQRAKQMAGSTNQTTKHMVLYLFFPQFALAADLNDVANPRGGA